MHCKNHLNTLNRVSGKVWKKKNSVEIFVKKCGNSVEKKLKSVEKKIKSLEIVRNSMGWFCNSKKCFYSKK